MKKLLLSISIAALAFTAMENASSAPFAGLRAKISGKTKEEVQQADKEKAAAKEAKNNREADVKAMKTCATDLTQQTLKLIKAFTTCIDKLKETATMKDASPNSAESANKVLLIRDAATDFLRVLLYCYAGCVNIENALKEKDDSDNQKSYFKQAMDSRKVISKIRANLGIDMVSMVELINDNDLEIYNAKKIKEIIKKLDGELRGTGKKNEVGLSTSWESALKKFEDQTITYYSLDKEEALDFSDDEVAQYPLLDFVTTGNHLENIRQVLSNIFPAFVAFVNDICDNKSNNGSSFIQSVRQALKIKGLQVSSELEYDENEAKAKKSRRQGNNNKYAKKKNLGEGSSQWGNTEAEDAKNYELSEEDEEFFDSERKKSAKARGSEAEKRSNKGKVKKTEEDEDLAESKKTASKKKSRDAEDVENEELSEEEEEFFDSERKKSAAKRKAKEDSAKKASKGKPFEAEDRSQLDDEDEPLPEDDEDDEDQKKTKKVTKKDVQKMDEALRAADKRRQATQSKGGGKAPAVKGQWRAAASEA